MRVRELRWSDFDALVETYYHLYEERAAGEPIGITLFGERPARVDEVQWFANLYRSTLEGETIAVVAEEGDRPVGNCIIHPVAPRRDSELGHFGELGILVDHRFRGRGAGTALLLHALEQARARYEAVRLAVFADNVRAKRLYERLGFRTYGRLPRAIRRGGGYIDEELMFLELAQWAPPPNPNR
jgi:ribosomal protein S18 acetylase RimI-like enzyme